jgi:methyl coenzyme M reductase subunit D
MTREKCTGGIAKVVEHLPSKPEALSSNPRMAKKINHHDQILIFTTGVTFEFHTEALMYGEKLELPHIYIF